jgi:hypothetical protein
MPISLNNQNHRAAKASCDNHHYIGSFHSPLVSSGEFEKPGLDRGSSTVYDFAELV